MTTVDPTGDRRHPGNADVISAVRSMLGTHVKEKHIDFEHDELNVLVEEHRELYDEVAPLARDTNDKVTLLVNDMYGMPQPTAADPDARDNGGWVTVLRSMQTDGVKVKKSWTAGQWLFFGTIGAAFITTCGAVISALLGV